MDSGLQAMLRGVRQVAIGDATGISRRSGGVASHQTSAPDGTPGADVWTDGTVHYWVCGVDTIHDSDSWVLG